MMDWTAIVLSLKLAAIVCAILIAIGLPVAYWLTFSRWRGTFLVEALVALPLVLPPTVIGFYLLVLMGSRSPVGRLWIAITGHGFAFTFESLIVASVLYSLPFAVQPLAAAFALVDPALIEASSVLGSSSIRTFRRVILPLSIPGVLTASVLTFAHTLGEFGVVLMVGGNLPGRTRTVSVAIYDEVQALNYDTAHATAIVVLLFAFAMLAIVYAVNRRPWSVPYRP
jgi:molybdate transport system permease protein